MAAELAQGEAERVSDDQPADRIARLVSQNQAADECRQRLGKEQQKIRTVEAVRAGQDERSAQQDQMGDGKQRARQPVWLPG